VASHAHHHHSHGIPAWLPLTPQTGIRRQRYYTGTLVALAAALIILGTITLWAFL
jgi:hypothetical protein